MRFIYTGADGERIPDGATRVTVAKDCTFVRAHAFRGHRNIVTLVCHDKVEKIERYAFNGCPRLRKVVMPGVKIAEGNAFGECEALTDVECDELEEIGYGAFSCCTSLRSVNMPSATSVEAEAFEGCTALTNAKFGSKLEEIEKLAFNKCYSLGRITIPLKDGIITRDNIFTWCKKLRHIDLVEKAVLHETIAALNVEDWRNDMKTVIYSINQIISSKPAGHGYDDAGWKAQAMRRWIRSVLGKIVRYKASHERVLDEAASSLQFATLPQDLVTNHVFSYLVALPSHSFEGEGEEESSDDDESY